MVVDISVRTTHGGKCLSLAGDGTAAWCSLLRSAVDHRSLEDVFATVEHLHLALAVVHTAIGGTNRFEGEEAHVLAVLGRLAVLVGCLDNLLTASPVFQIAGRVVNISVRATDRAVQGLV